MRRPNRALSRFASVLGFMLVAFGGMKLNQPEQVQEVLTGLGVPDWGISWIGWAEVVIGAVLAHGPTRTIGAWALSLWMSGALTVHLMAGDFPGASVPLVLLLVGVAVAMDRRGQPVDWDRIIPTPLHGVPREGLRSLLHLLRLVSLVFLFRWTIGGVAFWLCLPVLGWAHARRESVTGGARLYHYLLLYLLVLGLGAGGFWNFVGHFLMSDMVAESIGWATGSPFQEELAFYHLGTGVGGLLCLRWRDRFWIAASLPWSLFVYGAGFIHVREFLLHANTNPGNWSVAAVGGNFVIPTVILGLLYVYAKKDGFSNVVG